MSDEAVRVESATYGGDGASLEEAPSTAPDGPQPRGEEVAALAAERDEYLDTLQRVQAEKDYYTVLGTAETASHKDIQSAYRRLARRCHPDASADVKVPTLDGAPVTVHIPPGTPSGRTFRVPGHGVPRPRRGRGDLLDTVEVAVPEHAGARERAHLGV